MPDRFAERITFIKNIFVSDKKQGMSNLYALAFSLLTEPLKLKHMPVFAQIEPTTRCNLNCYMCTVSSQKVKGCDLSLLQFKYILNQLPYLRKVSLVGRGEPLLNPEIFDMIAYAKDRNIATGFATNAVVMEGEISRKIIDSGLDWLNISLDGADKASYENVRKGAEFERVINNVKHLIKTKGRRPAPKISVWFLLLRENMEILPKMVSLLKALGIDKLWVQSPHCWGDAALLKKHRKDFISGNNSDRARGILKETAKKAKREGVAFAYTNIPDEAGKRRCKRVWFSPYIAVDGYVTPCCVNGSDPNVINFGNIFERPFAEIWNNMGYQDFRKKLKERKNRPGICFNCPAYYENIRIDI